MELVVKMDKFLAIIIVLLLSIFGAYVSILFKQASRKFRFSFEGIFRNYKLIFALFGYGIGALVFVYLLKFVEVSILYPLVSASYIWVSLFSIKFLKERMNKLKWIGICLIIFGVSLIGFIN